MPTITVCIGVALIILGLAARILSDSPSITVMIPSFLGAALLLCGILAFRSTWRRHAMHAGAALALLGVVGSAGALPQLPALLGGDEVQRPLAVAARSLTFALCTTLLVLAIRSFVAARRARAQSQGQAALP